MKHNHPTHILDLPPEILEQVLRHLTYPELQKIQSTCRTFDTISRHIMSQSLSRLGTLVDAVIAGFLVPHGHQGVQQGVPNQRRLYRGVSSLMVLSGLLRTTQACSVHQVRAGEFPPLPAQFLQDARDAVVYASRRNPLVGRTRLAMLHVTVGKYFEQCVTSVKHLSSLGMFRTVVDVLTSLPGGAGTLVHTEAEIQYSKCLPRVRVFMPPIDPESECASSKILLLKLVQLGLHAVSDYVRTDQQVQVELQPSVRAHTELVVEVRLVAGGCDDSPCSLQHLRTITPSHFRVTFVVENPFKEFSHTFSNCSND